HENNTLGNESSRSGNKHNRSGNKCNGSSHSGNDMDIKPFRDTEPMAEDDSNITPDSLDMSHNGGKVD
nr:hypothetical protein [Tanacetum cinerariifolium]